MSDPIHVISLGAGVQSSTMALMAAHGEITPMPVAACFADTQAEPPSVYEWLDWLERQLPFPVIRATAGNLADILTTSKLRRDGLGYWQKSSLPVYTLEPDGNRGHGTRGCTYDFKVLVLRKVQRKIAKIRRAQKDVGVVTWIGISTDEAHRMKTSNELWVEHRYPLIESRVSRQDCLVWMENKGYPKPPRSGCVFCPYHSDKEWRRLKIEEPESFAQAVAFEQKFQTERAKTKDVRGIPFLHSSRIPLDQIDFSNAEDRGQANLFGNECEGMCGV